MAPAPAPDALAELAWAILEAALTGGPAQWLQLARDRGGEVSLELTEFRIGDMCAAGWLRGCPGQAAPAEGELRLWRADMQAAARTGPEAAQPDGSALFRLVHDADGQPRLNGHDVGGLARSLACWLAEDSNQ